MSTATDPIIYVARPTLRLDGEEDERLASLLTHLVMTEQQGGLSALELRLANSASLHGGGAQYAFDAGGSLRPGAELVVGLGDSSAPVEVFRGIVTGIEGIFADDAPPELVVLAEDALQRLRCLRRSRTYEEQSLAEIVRALAGEHALTPVIDGLDTLRGTEVQLGETDLGFLRRLAERQDADVQVVGTELHAAPRADVRRGALDLVLGEKLKRARVLADLAHQATRVTARGWDAAQGDAVQAESDTLPPGTGRGRAGAEWFREVFGERAEPASAPPPAVQAEADAVAGAGGRRRARRFLRIQGVTTGTPALRVGTHATVYGLGAWFSNTYYVTTVCHRYDLVDGYRTEFEGECARLGEP